MDIMRWQKFNVTNYLNTTYVKRFEIWNVQIYFTLNFKWVFYLNFGLKIVIRANLFDVEMRCCFE